MLSRFDAIRSALLLNPGVLKVEASSGIPGGQFNQNSIRYKEDDKDIFLAEVFVTSGFFDILQLKTAAGRVFSDDFRGDTTASFVIRNCCEVDRPARRWMNDYYYGDVNAKDHRVVKDFNIHSFATTWNL
jgi:hypothetical protein